jgi:PAS domain S-box-containing protein
MEDRAQAILDQVQAAIVATDVRGVVTLWNRHAEVLLGWSREETLGRELLTLGLGMDEGLGEPDLARLRAGEQRERDTTARRKDGGEVPLYVTQSPLCDERDELVGVLLVAMDISVRQRAERRLAAQYDVTRILSEATGVADAAPRIIQALCERLEWEHGALWGVDREANVLRCVQTWHATAEPSALEAASRHLTLPPGAGLPGRVWASGAPTWVPDVLEDRRFARAQGAARTGLRGAVSFPIVVGREILGVMEFFSRDSREPDPDLLDTMASIGRQAGQFIERKRAEEDVARRAAELDVLNKELEAFSYSVSHDLRAPLRSIDGFSQALLEDYAARLDDDGKALLGRVRAASQRMAQLIDALLDLARVSRGALRRGRVNLSLAARRVADTLHDSAPERQVEFVIAEEVMAEGDWRLLRVVLQNLFGNAWKFTSQNARARIEFGVTTVEGEKAYFVRDDGAGFDMAFAAKLFGAFQRLHASAEFPGTGIGLATVQRIIHRHGGRVWADGAVGQGATIYFTLQRRGG